MRVLRAAALAAGIAAAGCGYTKGYLGPELPPEQISRISFSTGSPLSISGESVDTVPVDAFNAGIDVLPGKHFAATSVTNEANERCGHTSCDVSVERDKDGYVKSRNCTCTQWCEVEVYKGDCSITFNSAAGRQYSIEIRPGYGSRRSGYSADIEVHETGNYKSIGDGSCSELRFDDTREYEKSVPSYDCDVRY